MTTRCLELSRWHFRADSLLADFACACRLYMYMYVCMCVQLHVCLYFKCLCKQAKAHVEERPKKCTRRRCFCLPKFRLSSGCMHYAYERVHFLYYIIICLHIYIDALCL